MLFLWWRRCIQQPHIFVLYDPRPLARFKRRSATVMLLIVTSPFTTEKSGFTLNYYLILGNYYLLAGKTGGSGFISGPEKGWV